MKEVQTCRFYCLFGVFFDMLLLPVLPYFSQFYLVKVHISWNKSNLRRVSLILEVNSIKLSGNKFPNAFVDWTLCVNWIYSMKCAFLFSKVVKNKVKQAKVRGS